MIKRLQEIERRLRALFDRVASLGARLQAVDDRVMQVAGAMAPMFGSSSAVTLGRAVGLIAACDGTTLGEGEFHFATAPGGTLTEGTGPTEACRNLVLFEVNDDAWLVLVKTPEHWLVIAVYDPCNDLARPE